MAASSSSVKRFIRGRIVFLRNDQGRICGENDRLYAFIIDPSKEFRDGDYVIFYASEDSAGDGVYMARLVSKNTEAMKHLTFDSNPPSAFSQPDEPTASNSRILAQSLSTEVTSAPTSAPASEEDASIIYGFVEQSDVTACSMTVFSRSVGRRTILAKEVVTSGCWVGFRYSRDNISDVHLAERPETFLSVKFTSKQGVAFRGIGICGHNLLEAGGRMWSDELGLLDVPREALREIRLKHNGFKSLLNLVKFLAYSRNGGAWAVESVNIISTFEISQPTRWPRDLRLVTDVVVGNQVGGQVALHSDSLGAPITVERAHFVVGRSDEQIVAVVLPTTSGWRALFVAPLATFYDLSDGRVLCEFLPKCSSSPSPQMPGGNSGVSNFGFGASDTFKSSSAAQAGTPSNGAQSYGYNSGQRYFKSTV